MNVQLLDGELENVHRLLSDDVGRAERTRAHRRLERDGIDVEALEDNFVTYGAIRTYIKIYRDVEYAPDETDPLGREADTLQQLRGRVAAATEEKIERLRGNGHFDIDDFWTLVNVQTVCEGYNKQWPVLDLLDNEGRDRS